MLMRAATSATGMHSRTSSAVEWVKTELHVCAALHAGLGVSACLSAKELLFVSHQAILSTDACQCC
jgi:hypothetical protein